MFQIYFFLISLIALSLPLGWYLAYVFSHKKASLVEKIIYKVCLINPDEEMDYKKYSLSVLLFSVFSFLLLFLMQLLQLSLPLNPQNLNNVAWPLALNTAVSFITNTNWQAYSGEVNLSYFVQSFGLTVQNFLSAAVGISVLLAFIRGLTRIKSATIGNFWQDMVKSLVYVLIPLSILLALALISQGVIQNFLPYVKATTLEGLEQIIPMGPAASQIAIKQLGTNGGGFFGANSSHPFENPTTLSNFLQMLAILLLPAALIFMFGFIIKAKRHALIIFGICLGFLSCSIFTSFWSENLSNASLKTTSSLEGKEIRLGITNSIIWSSATTAASNGSVNAMHESLTPLSGGIALMQMLLGEIIFGGVGSGLYGMILFVLLTVFLAGLMVGRTPEYLGKKIETFEIKMVLLGIIAPSALVLLGTFASILFTPTTDITNMGPHGFSELLYAWASAANNNGSAFGGLNANTNFYNIGLSIAMLTGRFGVLFPVLALAGSLAKKGHVPTSLATFSTSAPIFAVLLGFIIIVVGALTFMPALALGPVLEHFLMTNARIF